MARIRTIKPEFWTDEKLGPLDPLTRLVAVGLISQADDAGRILDSVRLIDGLLFAYDDSTTCRRSLDDLSRVGFIERGETESGQRVIQIVNWHHQRIDKPNLSAALDPICSISTNNRRTIDDVSSSHTNDLRSTINDQERSGTTADTDGIRRKAHSMYGYAGSEGTDPVLMKSFSDQEDRDRCLDIAIARLEAEGKAYQGAFFRSVLLRVIEEQRGPDAW